MEFNLLGITALLAVLPISELRGALPFALTHDIPLWISYPFCVILNALVAPLGMLFLSTANKLLLKWGPYERFFNRFMQKARTKVKAKVDKYGYLGIMLFVAIPMPITGAYSGTLGAWVLGMDFKKTCLAVLAGVMIAGVIMTLITFFGMETFSFFVKEVNI